MEGKTYAAATLTRYQTTRRHVNLFVEQVYHKKDMSLDELDYKFITKFETWFRNKRKYSNNTTMKYLKTLKAIVNMALKSEWIEKDPFMRFEIKLDKIDKPYLNVEEL